MNYRTISSVVAALTLLTITQTSAAESDLFYNPRTTYGEAGMLDMPSARMDPDGSLFLTFSTLKSSQRYNFVFQALPWLQMNFRYSRFARIEGLTGEFDRSFGLKMRLFQENEFIPDISVGIRDILGTGLYSAEYIAATKRVSDFDLTVGLGWGRLAGNETFPNIFGLIFPSFKTRAPFATTGVINFGQFFHGPKMGVFGGAVWHTPIEGLDFLAEYSSDKYSEEVAGGTFKVRMPVNLGASYKFTDSIIVSAGWLYGTSYGLTVSLAADPTVPVVSQKVGPQIPAANVRSSQDQISALNTLLDRRRPASAPMTTLPWVAIPPPDTDKLAIASALMSEEIGVRDVDLQTKTVMINARLTQYADAQCDRYAGLISNLSTRVKTVALTDFTDSSGRVAICGIKPGSGSMGGLSPIGSSPQPGESAPINVTAVEDKIRADISGQAIGVEALSVEPSSVWLYFRNWRYGTETEAAGRIARILMADAPPTVEIFHIISVKNGMAMRDFQISRSALERAATTDGTSYELGDAISLVSPPLSNPILDRGIEGSYPRYSWSIGPGLREGFFDPDRPLEIQILAALTASLQITHNITIEGRGELNLYTNFNFARMSDSLLPHVRSDANLYVQKGSSGIANLDAVYRRRLMPDVYVEAKAGYLESMFAGGGLQVLWRPSGERLAFGADLYEVWQRDFTRMFGVQNYHVLTGHASVYYASPWYGLNFALHAGRYLAGDYGATFEVTRRFETGIEIGAFATFTNVPFSTFGEGSFDKGIIVHIPFEWAMPFYSQSSYDLLLRSLSRDGGQRLDQDDSLYEETRSNSIGELSAHLDETTSP